MIALTVDDILCCWPVWCIVFTTLLVPPKLCKNIQKYPEWYVLRKHLHLISIWNLPIVLNARPLILGYIEDFYEQCEFYRIKYGRTQSDWKVKETKSRGGKRAKINLAKCSQKCKVRKKWYSIPLMNLGGNLLKICYNLLQFCFIKLQVRGLGLSRWMTKCS